MPWLDQALDISPDQHEAWLAAQDMATDLRADLARLLAQRRAMNAQGFLQGDDVGPKLSGVLPEQGDGDGLQGDAPQAQAPTLQDGLFKGDLIGPWRLLRLLGQGGMSVVWLAERDDGQVRRQVAIKLPHAGPGQDLLAARLRRERDFLAALEHPHIARLYDVGVTPQGVPYMALEFVDGQPIHTHCHTQQLPLQQRLQLFLQVLDAVQHAHQQLVLHRDLKPGNILVTSDAQVKLLDFGIAKLIRGTDGPDASGTAPSTELTQHSGQVLTPDYAAPEQIAGQPLTTASDVYALGVILFELLTGQRPYRLPRGTRGALEDAILAAEVRRPSTVWLDRDVSTLHPDAATTPELARHFGSTPARLAQRLRGDLDLIVAKALQKDPARRYPSAEALAQDIRRHLAREPITAQPDSRWYRARKYVQRHAWALGAVGAVVGALSVGLGLALWQASEARQEAAKAKAIQGFLVGLFENGDVEQPDALRKRQQTVQDLLVGSAKALGGQLKEQPQVRAELQGVLGRLLHNLALGDEAIAVRQQRVAQLQALNAPPAELAQAWRELADSQDMRGDVKAAGESLRQGLALCREAGMKPPALCWGMQAALGWQDVLAGKLDQARAQIEPALAQLRQLAPGSEQLAEALVYEGDALSNANQADAAYALYQASMGIRAKLWGARSVRLARERYLLGMSLWSQGRLGLAKRELAQAESDMRKSMGPEHTNTLAIALQRGCLEVLVNLDPEGMNRVKYAARKLIERHHDIDPRTHFDAENGLGQSLLYQGDLAAAYPHLVNALDLSHQLSGTMADGGAPDLNLAWYFQDTGQFARARQLLLDAISRLTQARGANHPLLADLESRVKGLNLAEGIPKSSGIQKSEVRQRPVTAESDPAALMTMGDFNAALPLIDLQLDSVRSMAIGDTYQATRYAAYDLKGRYLAGTGNCESALALYRQALATLQHAHADSPYVMLTHARMGQCLLTLGRRGEALNEWRIASRRVLAQPKLGPQMLKEVRVLQQSLGAF